jgi:hypothetical protein
MAPNSTGEAFSLARPRIDKLSRDTLLGELEFVAARLGFVQYGKRDFRKHGKYSVDPVLCEFGSWTAAMAVLRSRLKQRGVELSARPRGTPVANIFAEMERVWRSLGHRPSRTEWEAAKARISYSLIRSRFGGWRNACSRFIEFKKGAFPVAATAISIADATGIAEASPATSCGLRMKVLTSDNFRCRLCGRSPATHAGLVLHVDHIIPFSRGGKTVFENLQTACETCNLGKGTSELGTSRATREPRT